LSLDELVSALDWSEPYSAVALVALVVEEEIVVLLVETVESAPLPLLLSIPFTRGPRTRVVEVSASFPLLESGSVWDTSEVHSRLAPTG
jgi:hypothetical protein